MADAPTRTGVKMSWAAARTMRVAPKRVVKDDTKPLVHKPQLQAAVKKDKVDG